MLDGMTRRLGRTDWGFFIIAMALLLIGLVMIYSSSFHYHIMGWQDVTGPTYHFMKQLRFAGLGMVALLVGWAIDYHLYKRLARLILGGTLLTLFVMALIGRWLDVTRGGGNIVIYGSIQPVELAKIGAVIYIAVWLEARSEQLDSLSLGTVPFLLLLGIMAGLIIAQPDFSTAVVLVATATAMFFVAGANMRNFCLFVVSGLLVVLLPIVVFGYGRQRFDVWRAGPFSDPRGAGYQMIQSLQALSYGGLTGVGLGQSQQKMYLGRFAHTDFIFSIIAEEWGFVGAVAVLLLYGLWLWRGVIIARHAPDAYGRLLAVGLVSWVAFQAALSIAVATDSTPVTGTVLPFMSYGGSSLVTSLASVGILLNISRSSHAVQRGHR